MQDRIMLADGQLIDAGDVVGHGADGFVISKGSNHVMKIPILYGVVDVDGSVNPAADNELYRDRLEGEKKVYQRLHNVPGVAECIESTSNGILLTRYTKGSLSKRLASCREQVPPASQRWKWLLQAADIVARCHEHGVLIFDIALRNFLLDDDASLRIIDFANSSLLPPGSDITQANVEGCIVGLDLLHLCTVIYSIMAWREFSVDCDTQAEWSAMDKLPDLTGLEINKSDVDLGSEVAGSRRLNCFALQQVRIQMFDNDEGVQFRMSLGGLG